MDSNSIQVWLAGFWDGEGTIGMFRSQHRNRTYYVPYAEVCNTNYNSMSKVCQILSIPESKICRVGDISGNRKIRYRMSIQNSSKLGFLLHMIKPYLVIKGRQATMVLEYIDTVESQKGAKLTEQEIRYRETVCGG